MVDGRLANIFLTSVAYAADKFPDKWMEKIPYFRPREELESKSKSRSRSGKHSRRSSRKAREEDIYDDYSGDDYASDPSNYDRHGGKGHRRGASLEEARYEGDRSSRHRSPYNPADYAPADRAGHYPQPGTYNTRADAPVPVTAAADTRRPVSSSGPMPGYVPYAHIYQEQPQYSQSPRRSDHYQQPRRSQAVEFEDDPYDRYDRRSGDRYAQEYRDEPRHSHRNVNDRRSGHHSRGYDSDGDADRYHRRSRRH